MTLQAAPATLQHFVTETLHGVEITDPYRWLEDQESPETRAWLDTQIAYTRAVLGSYSQQERASIHARLSELLRVEHTTMPVCRHGAYFYLRRQADQLQYVLYRRSSLEAEPEALIDPHLLDPTGATSASIVDLSPDATLLAYSLRVGGEDEIEVHFLDLATRKELVEVLPKGRYFGVNTSADRSEIYYAANTHQGPRVFVHTIGTSVEADYIIFGNGYSADKIIGCELMEDGRYLLIHVYYGSSGTKTELHILDTAQGRQDRKVRAVVDNLDARIYGQVAGDSIYLQTNWLAPNGRVMMVALNSASYATDTWEEVVPELPGSILQSVSPIGGKLYLNYLENIASRVVCTDAEGHPIETDVLELPGIGTVTGPAGSWDGDEAFFIFNSFATPATTYRIDLKSGARTVWSSAKVPVDSESMVVWQAHCISRDGTRIPFYMVHHKDMPKDGNRPVYITGYGGFNVALPPAFSARAALWAERNGIYVVVNLRGGGEFGESWHSAGMLEKKQNVFDDLYAATEWLIGNGYTSAGRIAVSGRSNGGLLVGAALTQRPELYGAIVCGYPLLDMIRYHKFLVAGYWVPEYGSSEDQDQFKYLLEYSPYHRVVEGSNYPAVLLVTGDADTRVAPLHARKMAARLQEASGSGKPVLLLYDTKSGHSDGKPIDMIVDDYTDELAFVYANIGAP